MRRTSAPPTRPTRPRWRSVSARCSCASPRKRRWSWRSMTCSGSTRRLPVRSPSPYGGSRAGASAILATAAGSDAAAGAARPRTGPRPGATRARPPRPARRRGRAPAGRIVAGPRLPAADAAANRTRGGRQPAVRTRDRPLARTGTGTRGRRSAAGSGQLARAAGGAGRGSSSRPRSTRCSWPRRCRTRRPRSSSAPPPRRGSSPRRRAACSTLAGDRLVFAHPLYASAVYTAAASGRRRALHRQPRRAWWPTPRSACATARSRPRAPTSESPATLEEAAPRRPRTWRVGDGGRAARAGSAPSLRTSSRGCCMGARGARGRAPHSRGRPPAGPDAAGRRSSQQVPAWPDAQRRAAAARRGAVTTSRACRGVTPLLEEAAGAGRTSPLRWRFPIELDLTYVRCNHARATSTRADRACGPCAGARRGAQATRLCSPKRWPRGRWSTT